MFFDDVLYEVSNSTLRFNEAFIGGGLKYFTSLPKYYFTIFANYSKNNINNTFLNWLITE